MSVDSDDPRADPVGGAGAAVPELRRPLVLERLGGLVGLAVAAVAVPGAGEDLVVARRPGAVGRQVLATGLALHDRVRDRPPAARAVAGPGRGRATTTAATATA